MDMEYSKVSEVLAAYARGDRVFANVTIDRADFRGQHLRAAGFPGASLPGAIFDDAELDDAWFYFTDLPEASFVGANLQQSDFYEVGLSLARLRSAQLMDAVFDQVDLTGADLTDCDLADAHLIRTEFRDTTLGNAGLGRTAFSDVDVSHFCDAVDLRHEGPSYIDFRSVMKSYHHPGLKRFLVDCGVPPLIAEYTVDAARAEGEGALETLMRSTFISYGGPDEAFARRLYEELRAHGVTTFFFPETARVGRRIGDEVHSRIHEHDRVILVCSRDSLDRPGVRNEIQETFDREARDGGAAYLLPIRLDDYVLRGWADQLAERVRGRVVADFSDAMTDDRAFDKAMHRLLAELRRDER